jgi:4-amino-4-deoxy-L-arabinose transferase-like glycosyltransferase
MRLGWGLLAFVLVAAPWYVQMARAHPDYLRHFFLEQNLGYAVSEQARHTRPAWFYLPVLVYLMAPWSFFLPAALRATRPGRVGVERRTTLFLLCWAGVIFALFSIARSKLPGYIVPLLPPLALLVGVGWDRLESASGAGPRRGYLIATGFLLVLAGAAVGVLALRPPAALEERYSIAPAELAASVGALAVGLAVALALLRSGRSRGAFAALALVVVAVFVLFVQRFAPRVDAYSSARDLVPELERRFAPGQPLVVYGKVAGKGDSAVFYTGRRAVSIRGDDAIRAHLESPGRVFAMTTRDKLQEELSELGVPIYVVGGTPGLVLLSNRPDEAR